MPQETMKKNPKQQKHTLIVWGQYEENIVFKRTYFRSNKSSEHKRLLSKSC